MKKVLMLMMLVITLASCPNDRGVKRPELENQEQLSPFFVVVTVNGKKYIDIDNSACLSRVYEISKDHVGAVTKPVKLNILECNQIIGRATTEYGVFATWLENMRHWLRGFRRKQ